MSKYLPTLVCSPVVSVRCFGREDRLGSLLSLRQTAEVPEYFLSQFTFLFQLSVKSPEESKILPCLQTSRGGCRRVGKVAEDTRSLGHGTARSLSSVLTSPPCPLSAVECGGVAQLNGI